MRAVLTVRCLSRITNDVDTLGMGLNQSVTQIITSVATIIGVLVMMLSISPLMTLIALVVLPVSGLCVSLVVKKSQKHFYHTAGIPWTYQWSGGRKLWRSSGDQSL